jgi:hypothetical protein
MTRPDFAELVRDDRVHTSLYRDPAIFDAEMDRIFGSTWVWVAHASEVAEANSFKTTHVGRQPVIVTRDKDGRSTFCSTAAGIARRACARHGRARRACSSVPIMAGATTWTGGCAPCRAPKAMTRGSTRRTSRSCRCGSRNMAG